MSSFGRSSPGYLRPSQNMCIIYVYMKIHGLSQISFICIYPVTLSYDIIQSSLKLTVAEGDPEFLTLCYQVPELQA